MARWLRVIELEEMQQGYGILLAEAERCQCRHWLIDVRRRRNTRQLGAGWMVSTLLPELGPRLDDRTSLAYQLLPTFLRRAAADIPLSPAACSAGKAFAGEQFTEEHEALAWLQGAIADTVAAGRFVRNFAGPFPPTNHHGRPTPARPGLHIHHAAD